MDYAALDFGTNSVKVLVVRQERTAGPLAFVAEPVCVTRLGAGVDRTRQLAPDALARTLDAVRGFLEEVRRVSPAGTGIATATSAVRDAGNRELFFAGCRELLGAEPQLLSGDTEAETVFCGATADQATDTFCICTDIGGGSTELVAGFPGAIRFRISLDLGCVRLGERFGLLEAADAAQVAAARAAARALLQPAVAQLQAVIPRGRPVHVLASGGTAVTLAAIDAAVPIQNRTAIHGRAVTRAAVDAWTDRLLPLSLTAREATPCLPADRAPVLPAGLLILGELLAALGTDRVIVTTHGLRWGLVTRLSRGHLPPTWHWGPPLTRAHGDGREQGSSAGALPL